MRKLNWTEDLLTGIGIIDEQHQETASRLNRFIDVCAKMGCSRTTLTSTFGHLRQYVVEHFAFEESLMADYAYPQSAQHQQAHLDFRNWVDEKSKELESCEITADFVLAVNYHLVDHLQRHFCVEDRQLTTFLRTLAKTRPDRKLTQLVGGLNSGRGCGRRSPSQ